MKAVRFHEYGEPTVLRYEDVDQPSPGPGQVRLRVAATSFNGIDANIRAGFMQDPVVGTWPSMGGALTPAKSAPRSDCQKGRLGQSPNGGSWM